VRHLHPIRLAVLAYCGIVTSCVATPHLPKFAAGFVEGAYPPTSRRLQEQGRVLVEFRLDGQRMPSEMKVGPTEYLRGSELVRSENSARLGEAATKLIAKINATSFDQWDKTPIDAKTLYRVSVIFCVEDKDDCHRISALPDSVALFVTAKTVTASSQSMANRECFSFCSREIIGRNGNTVGTAEFGDDIGLGPDAVKFEWIEITESVDVSNLALWAVERHVDCSYVAGRMKAPFRLRETICKWIGPTPTQ
jgi:hypothetical protein